MHRTYGRRATSLRREISRRGLLGRTALAGAGLSGLFLAACGGGTSSTKQQPAPEQVSTTAPVTGAQPGETPRKGGTLTFYASEPVGFDPHKNDSNQTHSILSLFHAHLTRFSFGPDHEVNDYTPTGDLAESWEQPDQTTYVFKLRSGLRWQAKPPVDGRELTATDVAYTFERILKLPATFAASQFFVLDRVEAVDPRTVRFSLREPFAPFMNYLSGNFTWIVPREAVVKFGDLKGIEGAVGAGPWMVESYNAGSDITLVRNPNYYRADAPYIDRLKALFGRAPAAVDAAFKAGETPLVGGLPSTVDPPERFERLRKEVAEAVTFRWPRPSGSHLMMRTDKPPLNDVRVRHAMALAIDQDEWIANVLSGYGYKQPCVFRGVDGSLDIKDLGPGADAYTRNPKEAKRLLEAAGYPSGLTLQPFTVANRSAAWLEQAQLIQGYLGDVGITAKFDVQEYANFIGGAYRGKYDTAGWDLYRLYSDGDQVYDMFHTKGDLNQNHVADAQLDDLIARQRRTLDLGERRKVLADVQRRVAGQYYDIFIPYNEQLSLWRPKVRGFRPSGWYDQAGVWLHAWLAEG